MSVLDELSARLVAQGVGVKGAVVDGATPAPNSIFTSSSAIVPPPGPGPYITLGEMGGVAPTRTQNQASAATQRPMIQILVRASAYQAARAKAWAAYQALDGVFNTVLSGTMYLKITARQEPTDMGIDGNQRAMVVFNVDVEKSPS